MKKTLVTLANSVRSGSHCIAGRELIQRDEKWLWGPWIRPVSDHGEGEVSTRECTCCGGHPVEVLDAVEVVFIGQHPREYQPENCLIDVSVQWRRIWKTPAEWLVKLVEEPDHLWCVDGRRTDRIHRDSATVSLLPFQSLYLIRPIRLRFRIWQECDPFRDGQRKRRRAIFSYRGIEYDLPITDPLIDQRYFSPFPEPGEPSRDIYPESLDDCLIVVSLTAPFTDGYHYKVVASVLEIRP